MTLAAPIELDYWFDTAITRFLVIRPTSNSPQPVHVLNGFFYTALEGQRASKAAVDFVATKTGGGWGMSTQELRTKSPLSLPANDVKLDRARRAVRSLVAADGAVYKGYASFQLADLGLVTSDTTHFLLGELAARLAQRDPRGASLLKELVDRLAKPQPNPIWAIERLLAEPRTLESITVAPARLGRWWGHDPRCSDFRDSSSALVVRALELSVQSRDSLLGLQVLASVATLVGLLAFAQVPGILSGGGLEPLLCEAGEPGARLSVRASSADAFNAVDIRFREFLFNELLNEIRGRFHSNPPDGVAAVKYLRECKPKKLSGGTELTDQIREIFYTWRKDYPPDVAMARTLEEALTSAMGNKARDWFAAVGRHCGLVGPRRGNLPRLRVEVTLAPALVLAGIEDDDDRVVPMAEWCERLAARFGLAFGPNARTRSMTHRAAEDELEANQADLASLLSSLGLARRYSDGVTEVLNPLKIWSQA